MDARRHICHSRSLILLPCVIIGERSLAELGMLSHLKNDFGHRNVTSDVMNCFNHADNFLWFNAEDHVMYYATSSTMNRATSMKRWQTTIVVATWPTCPVASYIKSGCCRRWAHHWRQQVIRLRQLVDLRWTQTAYNYTISSVVWLYNTVYTFLHTFLHSATVA